MQPLKTLEQDVKNSQDWLISEYNLVQAGRITPAMLDGVLVSVYGSMQPIKACASMAPEGAHTLKVSPWDASTSKAIENAIRESGMPVSVSSDSSGIRVSIPAMTEDTRKELTKTIGKKQEEARIKVRQNRQDCDKALDELKKNNEINEDDLKRHKKTMQDIVDAANRKLDELAAAKEKEVMTV